MRSGRDSCWPLFFIMISTQLVGSYEKRRPARPLTIRFVKRRLRLQPRLAKPFEKKMPSFPKHEWEEPQHPTATVIARGPLYQRLLDAWHIPHSKVYVMPGPVFDCFIIVELQDVVMQPEFLYDNTAMSDELRAWDMSRRRRWLEDLDLYRCEQLYAEFQNKEKVYAKAYGMVIIDLDDVRELSGFCRLS